MTSKLPSWLFLFFSLLLLGTTESYAVTSERTLAAVAQFSSVNLGSYPVVYVSAYTAGGTTGGGKFLQKTCTPNPGTCFADLGSAHTFARAAPAWNETEWGFVAGGSTDNSSKMAAALSAASAAGVDTFNIITTGAYYFATGFSVPAFMQVKCAAPRIDQSQNSSGVPNGDHKSYPYSLLIPASSTVTLGTSRGVSATIDGCTVLNKAVYDTPNPTTLQSIYNVTGNGTNAGAFGGTGVTCNGDGCKFTNGQILGFTTGFFATGRDTIQLQNVIIDATSCVNILHSNLIITNANNFQCLGSLTTVLANGLLIYPIDTIAASPATPANYRYHLATACDPATGNCPLTGNIVWVGLPTGGNRPVGAESSAGRCTVKIIDNSNFECTNSQATASVATGTTVQNSTRVCGFSSLTYVRALQTVTGTGIPGGDTVASVAPRMGCVYLATAATASGSVSLTFTDNTYNPSGALNCSTADCFALRPFANHRFGTGVILDDVHNSNFVNFLIQSHDIDLQLTDGAVDNTISGCHIEDEQINLDSSDIGVDIEGVAASNIIGCNAIHVGANQATGILNNTGSSGAPNIISTGVVGSNFFADIALDMEAGNLNFFGSAGRAGPGDFDVSGSANNLLICNSYSANETLRYASAAADRVTQGCGNNVFASGTIHQHGTITNAVTATVGGGQAAATRVGTDYVRVNGVASAGAGIMLPPAAAGVHVIVTNAVTNAMQVYGYADTSDTINGGTSSVGIPQPGGTTWDYVSTAAGAWWVNTIQFPQLFANDNTAHVTPADTTEDTLATITLPANTLGANGCVIVSTNWDYTGSTNLKTMRIRFSSISGTVYLNNPQATSTNVSATTRTEVCNRNATNSQIGNVQLTGFGNSATALPTSAVDTTAATTLVITGQKATAGETLTLEQYEVLLEAHS